MKSSLIIAVMFLTLSGAANAVKKDTPPEPVLVPVVGPQGPQGVPGVDGNHGKDGKVGPKGDMGPQGPKGDTGAQGNIGPMGPKGEKGDQGIKGDRGATGPAGERGPRGFAGKDGLNGQDGKDGINGIDGRDGRDGADGMDYAGPSYSYMREKFSHFIAASNSIQVHLPRTKSNRATANVIYVDGVAGVGFGYARSLDENSDLTFGMGTSGGEYVFKLGVSGEF